MAVRYGFKDAARCTELADGVPPSLLVSAERVHEFAPALCDLSNRNQVPSTIPAIWVVTSRHLSPARRSDISWRHA